MKVIEGAPAWPALAITVPPLGGFMDKREPQIILKTDERTVVLELGRDGKFSAKSTDWDENRVFLEGDRLEVAVKNGRWVLTPLLAGAVPARETGPALLARRRVTPLRRCNAVTGPRCNAVSPLGVRGRRWCR